MVDFLNFSISVLDPKLLPGVCVVFSIVYLTTVTVKRSLLSSECSAAVLLYPLKAITVF